MDCGNDENDQKKQIGSNSEIQKDSLQYPLTLILFRGLFLKH